MADTIDLYLRKSQRDRQGVHALTFRAQEDRGRRWAAENGYTVRQVWRDNLSAWTDTHRPDFDRALTALRADETDGLWCYAGDRLTRKGSDLVAPLLTAGKRLIFDYERLDSQDPPDRRRIIDRAEEAREYSDLLSYRVRGTKERQREEGAWLGAAPYGYLIADATSRKLTHDPVRWPVVLRIFADTAEGKSARAIASALNAEGTLSPTGKTWGGSQIHRMVSSPVYEGWQAVTRVKGGRSVAFRDTAGKRVSILAEGVLPVPPDVVQRARQVVAGHARVGDGTGRPKHLLSGLLRCAGCGGGTAIHGRSYRCYGFTVGKPCPAPASVMRAYLDEYVWRQWRAAVLASELDDPSELMMAVAERWLKLTRPTETAEAQAAVAALKAAEAALEQLANDRAAGLYAGAMGKHFPRLVVEAEASLAEAQERVSEFSGTRVDLTMFDDFEVLDRYWDKADGALRRDLIRLAIDQVTITQGTRRGAPFIGEERVTIKWAGEVTA
ncbi:recombinase family protein [Streptomyces sp. NBC_01481]|uniref:recombinase family protein n=1 Tax=Streptomyces sp. NBC_01481 TaxID=2975869 RepID=UPI0022534534|nr:recombinase family protein [Streptomyces sp. NBC_01481]MCX4587307.1 recombinase family protein [Streptomyces sp. NBC_01481]